MGKKKDGKAKEAGAKDGGHKMPKRVAGIKLPKDVRRKGEALIEAAGSPAGRAAIAKGLTLAAGLATMAAQRSKAAAGPESATPPHPPVDPQKVAEAVSTVAEAVLGRLFPGKRA